MYDGREEERQREGERDNDVRRYQSPQIPFRDLSGSGPFPGPPRPLPTGEDRCRPVDGGTPWVTEKREGVGYPPEEPVPTWVTPGQVLLVRTGRSGRRPTSAPPSTPLCWTPFVLRPRTFFRVTNDL